MRRLRRTEQLRALVRETTIKTGDLVYPLFICPGKGVRNPVPGVFNLSVDEAVREAEEAAPPRPLPGLLLFGLPEKRRTIRALEAHGKRSGNLQQALGTLKQSEAAKKLVLIADVSSGAPATATAAWSSRAAATSKSTMTRQALAPPPLARPAP